MNDSALMGFNEYILLECFIVRIKYSCLWMQIFKSYLVLKEGQRVHWTMITLIFTEQLSIEHWTQILSRTHFPIFKMYENVNNIVKTVGLHYIYIIRNCLITYTMINKIVYLLIFVYNREFSSNVIYDVNKLIDRKCTFCHFAQLETLT